MKKLPYLILAFTFFVFLAFPSRALAVSLTSIGGLDTTGNEYAHWWYSKENPTLTGTSSAGDTVTVSIDGVADTVTADTSGNWSFPTTMTLGNDYSVVLSDATDSYSFTLTIGEMDGSTATSTDSASSSADLPVTGFGAPTVALIVAAGLLITSPFVVKKYL